ncbi:hypothetical protein DFH06DRAFT_1143123 [Mycena polygramma]|nr:hypothetical protein DFH06DRAFT_1143123 [Mycena polygramma]
MTWRYSARVPGKARTTTDAKRGQDRISRPSRTFTRGRSRTGKLGISHLANTTGRLRVCNCLAFGCEKNGREEKEVVNDLDRSQIQGRAEDRRRPEISQADGEVARADRSTEGQGPEVVRTEVGGRTGGEPEVSRGSCLVSEGLSGKDMEEALTIRMVSNILYQRSTLLQNSVAIDLCAP